MAGDQRSTQVLFREWRGGDASAGQAMAQRFADWYYAITTSRLGETVGRAPCENACARFGEGIVNITDGRELVNWAHSIVVAELGRAGGRIRDGDEPNAYTGNQPPKMLLVRARAAMPDMVALLEATYGGQPQDVIDRLAAPLGGNPLGVLKARYALKQWLRNNQGVPFEVAPDTPVLDRAPLPLYESARMATAEEEASFEHWMISDIDLCKDIAEFAHFAIALRGGLPADQPQQQQAAAAPAPLAAQQQQSQAPEPTSAEAASSGGGFPWLREHLIDGYRPQWYQWFPEKSADASIVNAPGDSRWYNYYIEGLKWMVENIDIDGLYLDDVSYDRRTVKRIRKVLDNTKPGCILDLHSNTGFSKGPATQYAEFFPYMDKLWFGESFRYDEMPPENWLVEVSGIPFGLMGDMLHRGGNRWLGMLYGMTVRHPWMTDGIICDPRPIWKVWDEFQIQDAEMIRFWNDNTPVSSSHSDVKVTVYKRDGHTLISIGNFSDSSKNITLKIDFERLGLKAENAKLIASAIQDFQPEKEWKVGDTITVEPRKGWLIYIGN